MSINQRQFKVTIVKYSHFYTVCIDNTNGKPLLQYFFKQFIQYKLEKDPTTKRTKYVPDCVYAIRSKDWMRCRFHINTLDEFLSLCDGSIPGGRGSVDISDADIPDGVPVVFHPNPKYQPRDYQIPIIDYLSDPTYTSTKVRVASRRKMLRQDMGRGKTLSALLSCAKIGKRIAAYLPSYLFNDQWVEQFVDKLGLTREEVMVIEGTTKLVKAIQDGLAGSLDTKAIIISIDTLRNMLEAYKESEPQSTLDTYGCEPEDLLKVLGCGVLIRDEVHQQMYLGFMMDLHTNVAQSIAMSGTMESLDPFVNRIRGIMFPVNQRYDDDVKIKHVNYRSVIYTLSPELGNPSYKRFGGYSHTSFEQTILRKPTARKAYMGLIADAVQQFYINTRLPGDKAVVFVSLIAMADAVVKELTSRFPDVSVKRYVGSDPYSNRMDPDIRVSTPLKIGTGADIPGLTVNIVTVAMRTMEGNLQINGRTRAIEGREVYAVYLVARNQATHWQYHTSRVSIMRERMKSNGEIHYHAVVK